MLYALTFAGMVLTQTPDLATCQQARAYAVAYHDARLRLGYGDWCLDPAQFTCNRRT